MKNYVILLAGGVGKRMQSEIPKQFLEVEGKPIIVYTIENFQRNEQVEKIVVVCVKEWIEHLTLTFLHSFLRFPNRPALQELQL